MLMCVFRVLESVYVAFNSGKVYYLTVTNFVNPLALTRVPRCDFHQAIENARPLTHALVTQELGSLDAFGCMFYAYNYLRRC